MAIYIDDRELVAAHRAGDNEAFDELVREHRDSLLAHAKRRLSCDASAEDALQEALVRAYKALPKFDGEYRLGPWLHRIMHNVCIDEAVRRRRDGEKTDKLAAQPASRSGVPSVEDELGLYFDDTELNVALDELPATQREALVLRFVDNLNYDEVAQMSGVSEENARARVSRARNAMRIAMKGVAAFPVVVFGLLRRGEKAAAAVTSTTGAATVSAHSVTAPALAEATAVVAQAAPAVVPVIAKAAVGLGLAAAVFTPTSDSAVHQAVQKLATEGAGLVVDLPEFQSSSADNGQVVAVEFENSPNETQGYSPIETVSPSPGGVIEESDGLDSEASNQIAVDGSVSARGGSLIIRGMVFSPKGGGRQSMSGGVRIEIDSGSVDGFLQADSWLRLDEEFDRDGQKRVDGHLIIDSAQGTIFSVRLAGFVAEEDGHQRLVGLYRADPNTLKLAESGSFAGSFVMDDSAELATFILTP